MNVRSSAVALLAAIAGWGMATPAIATPLAELPLGNEPLQGRELSAAGVRVVVTDYQPWQQASSETNLRYQIYVEGALATEVAVEVGMVGTLALQHLDPDGLPEVVLNNYTGGAHCCSILTVHSWQGDRLYCSQSRPLDASASGPFEDLDGDGYREFLSADTRFLYAFGSYASSWPPIVLLSFRDGGFVDVTDQFPEYLRSHAYSAYRRTRDSTPSDPVPGANSVLAGYVAQKILMGEYESGWNYMLYHYNPEDTWGLEERDRDGNVIKTYPDFPAALRAFLIDLGYLTPQGKPNPNLDLKPVIIADPAETSGDP